MFNTEIISGFSAKRVAIKTQKLMDRFKEQGYVVISVDPGNKGMKAYNKIYFKK